VNLGLPNATGADGERAALLDKLAVAWKTLDRQEPAGYMVDTPRHIEGSFGFNTTTESWLNQQVKYDLW